jgi:Fur family ferric uptake transcriptional regulator
MTDVGKLRDAGLRVTSARLAILETVRSANHLGAEQIARAVRERIGHVSVQAVYEALGALTAAGLIRRIEPAGSPARYEARIGDNHHHIVCRECGVIADVDCAVGHSPCLAPANSAGFSIDEAEVTFWGLCARCQRAGKQASAGTTAARPAQAGDRPRHQEDIA